MYKTDLQNDIKRAEIMKMRIFQEKVEHLRALSENMETQVTHTKPTPKFQSLETMSPPKAVPVIPHARMVAAVKTLAEEQIVDDFKSMGILHAADSETIAQKLKKSNVEIQGVMSGNEAGETKDTQIDRFQRDFADSMMSDKQRQRLQKKAQFAELLMQNQSKINSARMPQIDSFLTNTRDEDDTRKLDVSMSNSVLDRNPLDDPKLRFLKKALQVSKSAMNLHLKSDSSQRYVSEPHDLSVQDHSSSVLPAIKPSGQISNSKKSLQAKSERFNSNDPKRKETSLFQRNNPKAPTDVFVEGSQFKPISSAAILPGKIGGFKRVMGGSKDSVEGRGSARIIDLDNFLNKNLGVGIMRGKNHFRQEISGTKDRKAFSYRSIPTEPNDSHIEADMLNRGGKQKIGNSVLLDPVMPNPVTESHKSPIVGPSKYHSRKPFLIKQASAQDVLFSRP